MRAQATACAPGAALYASPPVRYATTPQCHGVGAIRQRCAARFGCAAGDDGGAAEPHETRPSRSARSAAQSFPRRFRSCWHWRNPPTAHFSKASENLIPLEKIDRVRALV